MQWQIQKGKCGGCREEKEKERELFSAALTCVKLLKPKLD
jgi:hypothetical protein